MINDVRNFFISPNLNRQVNSIVIVLIQKFPGADKFSDFRSICL